MISVEATLREPKRNYTYEYPRASLTVDCVVFGLDETLEDAALRELREETGLEKIYLEQVYTVRDIDRDPRERVVTMAYYALVKLSDHRVQASADARQAAWFAIEDPPYLAFDHDKILTILSMDILVELDEVEADVAHRAARRYRFDRRKYRRLTKQGFNFEI